MVCHAFLRVLPMRLDSHMPVDILVFKEAVRRHRPAPTLICLGHTGHRVGRQSLHQKRRSLVQAGTAELELLEFRLGPRRRFGNQCIHSKGKSNRTSPKAYKHRSVSLKVSMFFRTRPSPVRDVYNAMGLATVVNVHY